jgi:hypothetical protein
MRFGALRVARDLKQTATRTGERLFRRRDQSATYSLSTRGSMDHERCNPTYRLWSMQDEHLVQRRDSCKRTVTTDRDQGRIACCAPFVPTSSNIRRDRRVAKRRKEPCKFERVTNAGGTNGVSAN